MSAIAAATLVLGGAAHAGDGRMEINQARALIGAVTPGDTAGFPVDLYTSGSYILTSDLVVSDAGLSGIRVSTTGAVTIDLAGFAIRGPVTCTGQGSSLSCTAGTGLGIDGTTGAVVRGPLVVKNGRIEGFGGGSVGAHSECLLSNLDIRYGGGVRLGVQSTVPPTEGLPCILWNSSIGPSSAVFAVMVEGPSLLADNVVEGNRHVGVGAGEGSGSSTDSAVTSLLRNSIRRNGLEGVDARQPVLMIENAVDKNERIGAAISYFGTSQRPSLLLGNSFYENGAIGNMWGQIHFFNCATGTGYTNNVITPLAGGSTVVNCATADMAPNLCNGVADCP